MIRSCERVAKISVITFLISIRKRTNNTEKMYLINKCQNISNYYGTSFGGNVVPFYSRINKNKGEEQKEFFFQN